MILYFSSTGNSRWAASRLASSLGDVMEPIADNMHSSRQYDEKDTLGLVFPIHGWRPAKIVRYFLRHKRIKVTPSTFVYAVCTAGDSVGLAIDLLRDDIASAGLHLDAVQTLIMPESYVGLPFMDVDKPSREHDKKVAAEQKLDNFIEVVRRRQSGYEDVVKGPLPWLLTYPVGAFFLRHLVSDKPFRVSTDKCIRCGRCADLCPVGDIDGGKGKMPEWLHKSDCLTCFSCYHHCPTHAIEFGNRTRHKGQYFFERNKHK